jgi:hypothetical protein
MLYELWQEIYIYVIVVDHSSLCRHRGVGMQVCAVIAVLACRFVPSSRCWHASLCRHRGDGEGLAYIINQPLALLTYNAHFSRGIPVLSDNKTNRGDKTEIVLLSTSIIQKHKWFKNDFIALK